MKALVLGAGSRWTALAQTLAANNHQVQLWAIDKEVVETINKAHYNPKYLSSQSLSPNISSTTSLEIWMENSDIIVVALPSIAVEQVLGQLKSYYTGQLIVLASKWWRKDNKGPLSTLIKEVLDTDKVVVLSGGSHAEELIRKIPTSVVLASEHREYAQYIQSVFQTSFLRCKLSNDILGVQIFWAYKNIIALACGLSDGLGYGINTKVLILESWIAEIQKIAQYFGIKTESLASSAGVWDLFVTCGSSLSRNWTAGNLLAKGKKKAEILGAELAMIVEWFLMLEVLADLDQELQSHLPIFQCLSQIVAGNRAVDDAFSDFLSVI